MNNEDQIPDAEVVSPTTAVAKRDADTPPPVKAESVTPAQAKVNAIAELTMSAYARASELKLTPEEQAALQKEFPDEAFRPGAAGKENLIYIEHAYLRDRLNEVLGLGQWSIVPRNRWAEDFTIPASRDRQEQQASRVYVEAMLVVRGCFVAEAVGDMVYYKNNQSQNYGDAVEGAKTAALRRCTKELGIGLQAWKKEWCEGWWKRRNASGRSGGSQGSGQRPPTQPAPSATARPAANTRDVVPPEPVQTEADKDQRFRFLAALSDYRTSAMVYFTKKGWLTEDQRLEDLPNKYVPTTKKAYESIMAELLAFISGDGETDLEWWKKVLMPWGKNKDTPLGKLDKKYLIGLFWNYEVEEEYNGQRKSDETIEKDKQFRNSLDAAGAAYGWKRKE